MHSLRSLLVLAGLALFPVSAWAWGDEGHRIIALVAYAHLTPDARDKLDAILRGQGLRALSRAPE